MSILFDILHFVAAALLSVIGMEYDRQEECEPIHYQPAAYVFETEDGATAHFITYGDLELKPASDCDSSARVVTYPVL